MFLLEKIGLFYYKNSKLLRNLLWVLTTNKIMLFANPSCWIMIIKVILISSLIVAVAKACVKQIVVVKWALNPSKIINIRESVQTFLIQHFWFILVFEYITNRSRWAQNLHICGDVHQNPGPTTEQLKLMHWNLNSLKAHNFERLHNLIAYNSFHNNLHVLAITESALTKQISDKDIEIEGYISLRSDLVGEDTHGGVLVYLRNDLSAKIRTDFDLPSYTIVLDITIQKKKLILVTSYRKFGMSNNEYEVCNQKLDI